MRNRIWLAAVLISSSLLGWVLLNPPSPGVAPPVATPAPAPTTTPSPGPSGSPLAHLTPVERELWHAHLALMPKDPWPPNYYCLVEENGKTYAMTVGHAGFGSVRIWACWEKSTAWRARGQVTIMGEEAPPPKKSDYKELGLNGLSVRVQRQLLNTHAYRFIDPTPPEQSLK